MQRRKILELVSILLGLVTEKFSQNYIERGWRYAMLNTMDLLVFLGGSQGGAAH